MRCELQLQDCPPFPRLCWQWSGRSSTTRTYWHTTPRLGWPFGGDRLSWRPSDSRALAKSPFGGVLAENDARDHNYDRSRTGPSEVALQNTNAAPRVSASSSTNEAMVSAKKLQVIVLSKISSRRLKPNSGREPDVLGQLFGDRIRPICGSL